MAKKTVEKRAKAPNKIRVAGVVYEKLPDKIRVEGKVYELVKTAAKQPKAKTVKKTVAAPAKKK
jgi:hypothetical protein